MIIIIIIIIIIMIIIIIIMVFIVTTISLHRELTSERMILSEALYNKRNFFK